MLRPWSRPEAADSQECRSLGFPPPETDATQAGVAREGRLERGCVEDYGGHPDSPCRTETFIPKSLSGIAPSQREPPGSRSCPKSEGSWLVGQREDGYNGLASLPQGGMILQAIPAAGVPRRGAEGGSAAGGFVVTASQPNVSLCPTVLPSLPTGANTGGMRETSPDVAGATEAEVT